MNRIGGFSDPETSVSKHWSDKARERQIEPERQAQIGWLDSRAVLETYINPAISGQSKIGWFEWVMNRYVPKASKSFCTLGCGDGGLERHARFLGYTASFDSLDISEGALDVAREQATSLNLEGITYQQADLNCIQRLPHQYEVVFGCMSLHHVLSLQQLFEAVDEALIPGGLLIFNEFVGPRKFQWSDLQIEIVNAALEALPLDLKRDLSDPPNLKGPVLRPTIEEMNAVDPSEAALSDQIMPLAHRFFEPSDVREYGGTVLHLLLDRIIGNFCVDVPAHWTHLLDLFDLERSLLKTGVLSSDFTVGVFKKR
ncbi:MAG: class I SAM-dependent methyltransferase [Thermoanaerobaculia bacterium]|nr:class I SAM-dependent methyltransferase [Thermoanaerobaculia bacterium]